ncbi:MAG: hypothetical protein EPO32_02540 [Anaerolineae bacterium]|nr:MAG: hypothetical protein EPO32_02540 [Anaerolineae bacterium]
MFDRLRPVWIVARRELIDQLRDWRILSPIILLTVLFPAIMNFTADRIVNFTIRYGADIVGERLIPFLLMMVGFFPVTISLVIALESFAGEKERGSIEPLLSSPLEDWQLYLGKLIAVMAPPLAASYMGIVVYLVGVYRELGWVAEPALLLQVLALTFMQGLVMISGAVVISTQTTSVRAANLLASFIIIPMAFVMQGESIVMFWGQYYALWWAVAGMGLIGALLVRTGIGHFNREELLGRELDVLNFGWMWRVFAKGFRGTSKNVADWYLRELPLTLREMRLGLVFMMLMFIGAFWVGKLLTGMFPIPSELLNLESINQVEVEGLDSIRLFSSASILPIFLQNLRVMVFAVILGLFSYSVAGILLMLLPFAILGYFGFLLAQGGLPIWQFFAVFVLPHGIFEIPAILLAGTAILRMGANLAAPALGKSITEGVLQSFADWAKIMLGVVLPLLLAAAMMEALVTPQIAIWLLTR